MGRKLNKNKVYWIIKKARNKELSITEIARIQGISRQYVYKLVKKYSGYEKLEDVKRHIEFKRAGRKEKKLTKEELELIKKIYTQTPVGAINMEKLIKEKYRIKISHNRIHRGLIMLGYAKPDAKKKRRRKWVRYERSHSNSLWHGDWFYYKGYNIIVYEDDASRFITGIGYFKNATSKNAIKILDKAIKKYGKPKQLITDHGTQFTSLPRESCNNPRKNQFQKYLEEQGIKHIKARRRHPQTNGKIERLIQSLKRYYDHFGDWEEVIKFYNFIRPHMSLETEEGNLVRPYEAFIAKKAST